VRLLIARVKDRPVRAGPDTLLASFAFLGLTNMSMFMDRQINFANNIVGTRLNAHPARFAQAGIQPDVFCAIMAWDWKKSHWLSNEPMSLTDGDFGMKRFVAPMIHLQCRAR
jgi:hypothetical protein